MSQQDLRGELFVPPPPHHLSGYVVYTADGTAILVPQAVYEMLKAIETYGPLTTTKPAREEAADR